MTTYDLSGSNYSETDASNSNAAPAGMPEGMAPSGVNDAWRSHAGAVKRAYDWDHAGAWATVGGTGNAITLAYPVAPNALIQGEKFAFLATAANTGATTANVASLGVKNIFKKTLSGVAACTGGEIEAGDIVEIEYDGTQFQIVGGAANAGAGSVTSVGTAGLATGGPITGSGTVSVTGSTKAQMQAGTDTTTAVTPSVAGQIDGAAKAHGVVASNALTEGFNIASVTHSSTGVWAVAFTTNLGSGNFAVSVSAGSVGRVVYADLSTRSASGFTIKAVGSDFSTPADVDFSFAVFGR